MNKYCKKVLRFLNKNSYKLYMIDEISNICKIEYNLTNQALQELLNQNLIDCSTYNNNQKTFKTNILGKFYFKENLVTFIKSLFNSIVCPIIVSMVTTLITIWIKQ